MNIGERRKWNNILIFICCALIIALILTNLKQGEKNLNEIYPIENATKITFNNPEFSYTLAYKKAAWQLTKPFVHSAISENIKQITSIQNSDIYKHIKDYSNISEFGFDENTFLTINKLKIYFGDQSIDTQHRYIKIGERIFLIEDTLYPILSSGPGRWLGKDLLSSNDNLLTSISIGDNLYKEAELINLADAWYDTEANSLFYPADNFITLTTEDIPITVTFANNKTLQFLMHKQRFLVNTTFNLAYELSTDTATNLLTP